MSKIHKLSDLVVSKTAAGQIIESPYDVIKELVENALDAHATNIVIELVGNGFEKIKIIDDGIGMSEEDLHLSVASYSTSKINEFEDIDKLSSFGFRGEALHALSVVSKLKISSREVNSKKGAFISVLEGNIVDSGVVGIPVGTQVEVLDIFYNFPARLKSFKDTRAVYLRIVELIGHFSLIYNEVSFSLYNEKKLILKTNSKMTIAEKFRKVLGTDLNNIFLPVSLETSNITISGYIVKPQHVDRVKSFQLTLVNDRLIKNREIVDCIKNSYSSLIPFKASPAFILKLKIDGNLIDPNVDPKKERVVFRDISIVSSCIQQSVSQIFQSISMQYEYTFSVKEKADAVLFASLKDSEVSTTLKTQKPHISEIFQVGRLYIVRTAKDGIDVFDQHAVHERVLYEEFLKAFEADSNYLKPLRLKPPIMFGVSIRELQTFTFTKDILIKSGFDIEVFGNNSLRVNEVPSFLKTFKIEKILKEFLSDIPLKSTINNEKLINSTISYLACRSAIKSGDYLEKEEMNNLIKKIDALSNLSSYTCPHGRPIRAHLSLSELGKIFKR